MQRSIPTFGLLFTSVSAIIGSGWLFSAFYTATLAGPAATLAWIIGGIFVLVIAFVFAEVCSMLPITGSSARVPQYTGELSICMDDLALISCIDGCRSSGGNSICEFLFS
jgi:amino acid transporter